MSRSPDPARNLMAVLVMLNTHALKNCYDTLFLLNMQPAAKTASSKQALGSVLRIVCHNSHIQKHRFGGKQPATNTLDNA